MIRSEITITDSQGRNKRLVRRQDDNNYHKRKAVPITGSIKIVDAGYRGVLLSFGAVDTTESLEEGIHFVVPVRDNVVQIMMIICMALLFSYELFSSFAVLSNNIVHNFSNRIL